MRAQAPAAALLSRWPRLESAAVARTRRPVTPPSTVYVSAPLERP